MTRFPELGFYAVPGEVEDPRRAVEEARAGEALGLGSVWISERLGSKDLPVLSGAIATATSHIHTGAGLVANLPLRHPLVLASYAATMSRLSGGRFLLGLGRGIPALARGTGSPALNFARLEAYVTTLRALWRGEPVDRDAGHWQLRGISLGTVLESPPPIMLGVEGDRTCRWAGAHCDGVVIQAVWSAEGTARSVRLVREGAEQAGRDPDQVRILATLITACEVPDDEFLLTIIRRWNTYLNFPGFLDNVCHANGWDRAKMEDVRHRIGEIDATSSGTSSGPWGDEGTSRELDDLRRAREIWPEEWLHQAFAVGDRDHCASATRDRFDAGVDEVIFHGSTPDNLAPLLTAWPAHRPGPAFTSALSLPNHNS